MLNNFLFPSPFKRVKLVWYFGKIAIGTPYFLPRVWKKDGSNMVAKPRKIGFDFVELGWKTKWEETDYRFEWAPVWSFVFFKWQLAVSFKAPEEYHYWECWLYYNNNTNKRDSIIDRIKQAKEEFPCKWITSVNGETKETCYWNLILKEKYKL